VVDEKAFARARGADHDAMRGGGTIERIKMHGFAAAVEIQGFPPTRASAFGLRCQDL
jgi:hypothetical protein